MSLEGAQFICLDEAGNRGKVVAAKGRKFTVGYYTSCDLVIDDERAKGVHCTIECDAFGRITIRNLCADHPITIKGENVENKRILFNKTIIRILDKSYLWEFATKTNKEYEDLHNQDVSTPQKQIGIPKQSAFSCPNAKHTQKEHRLTVHNFAYCIQSDEDGNNSVESNDNETSTCEGLDVEAESETKDADVDDKDTKRDVSPEPESRKPPSIAAQETPKMNLINFTNNKENTSSTHKKNHVQLSLCHQSDVVITSFSPRETGVKTEKSFTAILKPKVLVTRAPNTPKSVYSTPKSILGDDDDDENDRSRDFMNFHTPSSSRKGLATNTASKTYKNTSMHLVDFTTPSKFTAASPYLKSALKASAKKHTPTPNATKSSSKEKCLAESEQLGVSAFPITPVVSDDNNTKLETPSSALSVISVDSTDTSSVIEVLSDESTSGANSNLQLKTPAKSETGKVQVTTPMRTPQSLIKRAILTNTKKQITTPQRTQTVGAVTPRREPINRIPLRTSIGSPRSPATPTSTGFDILSSRRNSMSTPSRKSFAAPAATTPSTSRRSSLLPMSATKALPSTSTPFSGSYQKRAMCQTSPRNRVRKSVGGVPLSTHISKARRSIMSAAPSQYTSIKEKSPQQVMSDRLLSRARKSMGVTPHIARAILMVKSSYSYTSSAGKLKEQQSARKSLAARSVLFADKEKKGGDKADLSQTFVLDSDEEKDTHVITPKDATFSPESINDNQTDEQLYESKRKDATFSPEKEKTLNLTFSPEKNNVRQDHEYRGEEEANANNEVATKCLEIPLDVEEVVQTEQEYPVQNPQKKESENTSPAIKESKQSDSEEEVTSTCKDMPQSDTNEDCFAEIVNDNSQEEITETHGIVLTESKNNKEDDQTSIANISQTNIKPLENETGFGEESLVENSERGASQDQEKITNGNNSAEPKVIETPSTTDDCLEKSLEPTIISEDKDPTKDAETQQTSFVYKPIYEDITLESSAIEKETKEVIELNESKKENENKRDSLAGDSSVVEPEQIPVETHENQIISLEEDSSIAKSEESQVSDLNLMISADENHIKIDEDVSEPTTSPEEAKVEEQPDSLVQENTDEQIPVVTDNNETEVHREEMSTQEIIEDSYNSTLRDEDDIHTTSKLLEEIEDVLNKSDEIKQKHLEEREEIESIQTLTEENESVKLTQESNLESEQIESDHMESTAHKTEEKEEEVSDEIEKDSSAEEQQATADINNEASEKEPEKDSSEEAKQAADINTVEPETSVVDLNKEVEDAEVQDKQVDSTNILKDSQCLVEEVEDDEDVLGIESQRPDSPIASVSKNEDVATAPKSSKKLLDNLATNLTPKRRSRRTSMLAETLDDTKENIYVSVQNVAKILMETGKELTLTPRRSSRRKSSSTETSETESNNEQRPLPTFTPRHCGRRASISVETSSTYTPSSKKTTRRASISAISEAPLTPKRITRRRSSISLDTDEAVKVVQESKTSVEKSLGICEEMSEDMGAIVEEEEEAVIDEEIELPKAINDEEKEATETTPQQEDNITNVVLMEGNEVNEEDVVKVVVEENVGEEIVCELSSSVQDSTQNLESQATENPPVTTENDLTQGEENVHDLTQDEDEEEDVFAAVASKSKPDLIQGEENTAVVVDVSIHDLTQNEESFCKIINESVQDLTQDEENIQDLTQEDEENVVEAITVNKEHIVIQDDEQMGEELANTSVQDLTQGSENISAVLGNEDVQDLTQDEESLCEIVSQDLTKDKNDKGELAHSEAITEDIAEEDMQTLIVSDDESANDDHESKGSQTPKSKKIVRICADSPKTPVMTGVRELLKTPKPEQSTPTFRGIRHLVRTPKTKNLETEHEEIEKLQHLQDIVKTPRTIDCHLVVADAVEEIDSEDQNKDLRGVKELLNTPKSCSTPRFKGMRELMQTPKVCSTPILGGVKELLESPTREQPIEAVEMENPVEGGTPVSTSKIVEKDMIGVKELLKTPKTSATPRFKGMRELLQTPKVSSTPALGGVKELLNTPNQEKQNESIEIEGQVVGTPVTSSKVVETDMIGVKDLLKTPKTSATPRFKGMRELMQTPKVNSTPIFGGVKELLNTPTQEQYTEGDEPTTSSQEGHKNLRGSQELMKTPKSCSTQRLKDMRDLMQTPKVSSTLIMDTPKQDQEKNDYDKFLKTPTAKNIMIPTLPSSVVIEKNKDSVEMVQSIEYDLNDSHEGGSPHLEELFKTPGATRFVERITESFYGEEGAEECDTTKDSVKPPVEENTGIQTPVHKCLQRKSLAVRTPHFQSPFSAAEVLSDLSKADVEEWVGKMDPLQQTINLDDENEDTEQEENSTNQKEDESVINLNDSLNDSLSMVPETCSKINVANISVSVANASETMINLSSLDSTASKDPLATTVTKLKQNEKRPYTPTDAGDISGINLLDQTGESALDESLLVTDDEETEDPDVNKDINNITKPEDIQNKTLCEDDNDLTEPLLLSDNEETEKHTNEDTDVAIVDKQRSDETSAEQPCLKGATSEATLPSNEATEKREAEQCLSSDRASEEQNENQSSELLEKEKPTDQDKTLAQDVDDEAAVAEDNLKPKNADTAEEIESVVQSSCSKVLNSECEDIFEDDCIHETTAKQSNSEEKDQTVAESALKEDDDSINETAAKQSNSEENDQTVAESVLKEAAKADNVVIELTSDDSNDCKVIDSNVEEEGKMTAKETKNIAPSECEDIFMDDSSVSEVSASQKDSNEGSATIFVESSSEDGNENNEAFEDIDSQKSIPEHSNNHKEENDNKPTSSLSLSTENILDPESIHNSNAILNEGGSPAEEDIEDSSSIKSSKQSAEEVALNRSCNTTTEEHPQTLNEETPIEVISEMDNKEPFAIIKKDKTEINSEVISIDDSDSCEEISSKGTVDVPEEIVEIDEKDLQTISADIVPETENPSEEKSDDCLKGTEMSSQEVEQSSHIISITSADISVLHTATKPEEEREEYQTSTNNVTDLSESQQTTEVDTSILVDNSDEISANPTDNEKSDVEELPKVKETADVQTSVTDVTPNVDTTTNTEEAMGNVEPERQEAETSVLVNETKSELTPEAKLTQPEPKITESESEPERIEDITRETTDEAQTSENVLKEPISEPDQEMSSTMNDEIVKLPTDAEDTTNGEAPNQLDETSPITIEKIVDEEEPSSTTDVGIESESVDIVQSTVEVITETAESHSEKAEFNETQSKHHMDIPEKQIETEDITLKSQFRDYNETQNESHKEIAELKPDDERQSTAGANVVVKIIEATEQATNSEEGNNTKAIISKENLSSQSNEKSDEATFKETVKSYDFEIKITDAPTSVEDKPEIVEARTKSTRNRKGSQSSVCSNDGVLELPKTTRERRNAKTEENTPQSKIIVAELPTVKESDEQNDKTKETEIVPNRSEECHGITTEVEAKTSGEQNIGESQEADTQEDVPNKTSELKETNPIERTFDNPESELTNKAKEALLEETKLQDQNAEGVKEILQIKETDAQSQSIDKTNKSTQKRDGRKALQDATHEDNTDKTETQIVGDRNDHKDEKVECGRTEDSNETPTASNSEEAELSEAPIPDVEAKKSGIGKSIRRKVSQDSAHEDETDKKETRKVRRRKGQKDEDVALEKILDTEETTTTSQSQHAEKTVKRSGETEEFTSEVQEVQAVEVVETKEQGHMDANEDSAHRDTITHIERAVLENINEHANVAATTSISENVNQELKEEHAISKSVANEVVDTDQSQGPIQETVKEVKTVAKRTRRKASTDSVHSEDEHNMPTRKRGRRHHDITPAEGTGLGKIEESEEPIPDQPKSNESSNVQENPTTLDKEVEVLEVTKDQNEGIKKIKELPTNKRSRRKASEDDSNTTRKGGRTKTETTSAEGTGLDDIVESKETTIEVQEPSASLDKEPEVLEVLNETNDQQHQTKVIKEPSAAKRTRRKASQDESSTARKGNRTQSDITIAKVDSLDVITEHEETLIDLQRPSASLNKESDALDALKPVEEQHQHTELVKEPAKKRNRRKPSQDVVHEDDTNTAHPRRGGRRKAEEVVDIIPKTAVTVNSVQLTEEIKEMSNVKHGAEADDATKEPIDIDDSKLEHTRKGGRRKAQVSAKDNTLITTPTSEPQEDNKPEVKSDAKEGESANKVSDDNMVPIARNRRRVSQDTHHEADKGTKHTRRGRHVGANNEDTVSDKTELVEHSRSVKAELSTVAENSNETVLKSDHTKVEVDATNDDANKSEEKSHKKEANLQINASESSAGDIKAETQKKQSVEGVENTIVEQPDISEPPQVSEDKVEDQHEETTSRKTSTRRKGAAAQKQVEKPAARSRRARKVHETDEEQINKFEDEDEKKAEDDEKPSAGTRRVKKVHESDGDESSHPTKVDVDDKAIDENENKDKDHEHDNSTAKPKSTRGTTRNVRKKLNDSHDQHETDDQHDHEEAKTSTKRRAASKQLHDVVDHEVKASSSRKRAATRKNDGHEDDHVPADISHVDIMPDAKTVETHSNEDAKTVRSRRKKDEHKEVAAPTTIEEQPGHSVDTKTKARKRKESHSEQEYHIHQVEIITPQTPQRMHASNDEHSETPESERRNRNVPQRRAAIAHHNYDETSDTEKPEKKKKKTDPTRKSLEAAKVMNVEAIKSAESSSDNSPVLLASTTTARGRTRKPTARVQKFLEEERAKAESPKKRGGVATTSVAVSADTPTKRQPAKRGGKAAVNVDSEAVSTPQSTKRVRGKNVPASTDEEQQPLESGSHIVPIVESNEEPEHKTPPPATTTSKVRKGGRKAKAADHDDATLEPPAKKSPQQLEAEKERIAEEMTPQRSEDLTPARTTGRRNAAAAAKARIEEDAIAAAAIDPPKKARARKAPAKAAVTVTSDKPEQGLVPASTEDGKEDLQTKEQSQATIESKPTNKRGTRKAAVTAISSAADSPAAPAKKSRKGKATIETDEIEADEPKTSRAAARNRKNVHFATADQKSAATEEVQVEQPAAEQVQVVEEEPPATTTKRATRVRRK